MSFSARQLLDRLRNRTAAFTHDLLMVPIAWFAAYWVRFNLGEIPEPFWSSAVRMLPIVALVQGVTFWYLGLYRGVWRFASIPDLIRIVRAVLIGLSLSAMAIFLFTRMQGVPRSVLPLYGVLLTVLLSGPRLAFRWLKDRRLYYPSGRKALVVGAGAAGETLVRELLRDSTRGFVPIAFVDDDKEKKGREIHGVRVLGGCEKIPRLAQRLECDLALIAMPSANADQMRRIVELCETAGVSVRTLPALRDLIAGRSSVRELREISIEDLLGRDPVKLDWARISETVAGRTVLISGGGGSIGAELCRQIARLGPRRVVILDASEHNLYTIEMELRAAYPRLDLCAMLANVCEAVAVEHAFKTYEPNLVLHAAAYKHVPMLERHAVEAVRNNVLGTETLAHAAGRFGAQTFVLISSDKAVNPTNVMGATKRVAEVVCQAARERHPSTAFITVRFGNVLDSAGSVVPLFRSQIAKGGPVTVTHPEATRFFMTIPEACQLILEAASIGRGGEIYVLDMGRAVSIRYLAEQMIRLAGKSPGDEIEISYVGLRPGEKLYEELFLGEEQRVPTGHEKLLLAQGINVDGAQVADLLASLHAACATYGEAEIRALLPRLVGELSGAPGAASSSVVSIDKAKSS